MSFYFAEFNKKVKFLFTKAIHLNIYKDDLSKLRQAKICQFQYLIQFIKTININFLSKKTAWAKFIIVFKH